MTTFQAIVISIITGFSEFLPISAPAHHMLISQLLEWPIPSGPFAGVLALGCFLALLLYFRHDWASIISSGLQVVIFRKRPMTLDERLPFFIILSTLPTVLAWYYLRESSAQFALRPVIVAGGLAVFALPLWFSEVVNRKNKGMFDWNWFDALLVGFGQALLLIPGIGRMTGALLPALFRNFNREAASKFVFFSSAPILAGSAIRHLNGLSFKQAMPMADTSWLTLAVTLVITTFVSLLAIGGFMKNIQRKGFGQYSFYRILLALVILTFFWIQSGGIKL